MTISEQKSHRPPGSKKSLSWGEGLKLTNNVFQEEHGIDTPDAKERQAATMKDATQAFRETNQAFLNDHYGGAARQQPVAAATAARGSTVSGETPVGSSHRNPISKVGSEKKKKPPLSGSAGLATGRGQLQPIGDDIWSGSSKARRQKHRRGASHGTMVSALTTDSSLLTERIEAPPEELPPAKNQPGTRSPSPLEDRLMKKLLSKAYNNRDRGFDQMSYSVSSVGTGTSFATSGVSSQTSGHYQYQDSRTGTGRSDDNSSLASTEFSLYGSGNFRKEDGSLNPQDKEFIRMYFQDLEEERSALMAQWREEFEQQNGGGKRKSTIGDAIKVVTDKSATCLSDPFWKFLSYVEVFIANMPMTIAAVGLSWVTQGVIWFKFMEENIDTCTTVRFNSPECSYPEFPGCFECDTTNPIYRAAVTFHYFCHMVALTCCLLFLTKCLIAWRVVADELSNPTTMTPCGVVCITLICVAAGRGFIGEVTVILTSIFHILLSFWFMYIAIYKFGQLPDPGWFPNTVGIAYAAVKTWLYFPIPGLAFMALCMAYLFTTFPIAIYRAYYNHKVSAPVCFISLSAPSITMYAMTIMAQSTPSTELLIDSDPEFARYWTELHRDYYIPVQHGMMILSLIGFASSLQCLWTRWPQFKLKAFSPAHIAFIFPILSHTNAVQAFRAGFNSFSTDPPGSPFRVVLYSYWLTCLVVGTTLNFIFTYKYATRLPQWTKLDETIFLDENDEIPPSPSHTIMHEMMSVGSGYYDASSERRGVGGIPREIFQQSFTSPAVLQANEAGILVRVRRGTEDYETYGPYVRTRNISSLGFDLTLTNDELRQERAELLHWVAKHAPRTRNRTLSIPQMFKWPGGAGTSDGATTTGGGHHGIYGTFGGGGGAAAAAAAAAANSGSNPQHPDGPTHRNNDNNTDTNHNNTEETINPGNHNGLPPRHQRSKTWAV